MVNLINKNLQIKKFKTVLNPMKKILNSSHIKDYFDENLFGAISGIEILNLKILAKAKKIKIISRSGVRYINYLKKNNTFDYTKLETLLRRAI